ncbi:MAG: hypothetical protein HZR80_18165 [Candidatus Heimdallarchaeota archaeon]
MLEFIKEITVKNPIPVPYSIAMVIWMFLGPVLLIFLIWFIVRIVKHSKTLPKDKTKTYYLIKSSFFLLSITFLTFGFLFIPDIIWFAVQGFSYSFSLYLFLGFSVPGLILLIIAFAYQDSNRKDIISIQKQIT